MEGFYLADTDYALCMDCDFQHPVEVLKDLVSEMDKGANLCVGVRNSRMSMGFVRAFGSEAVEAFCKIFFRIHGKQTTKDMMSGLFAVRCSEFHDVIAGCWDKFEYRGWKVLMDLMKYETHDVKVAYVRYDFGKRAEGDSHLNPKVAVMTLHQLWGFGKWCSRILARLYRIDYYEMYPDEAKEKKKTGKKK